MFDRLKKAAVVSAPLGVLLASNAHAAGVITMPAIDLTDFYAAGAIILGVTVAVMLFRKVKGLIR